MKKLTDTEKQQLDAKIKEEQERQHVLREANPYLPESFEAASAETRRMRSLAPKHLWKYGFLVVILCLLVLSIIILVGSRNFGYDQYGGLAIGLMLLFNHIAFNFAKTGWKSRVMKIVAFAWIVLVFIYGIHLLGHLN